MSARNKKTDTPAGEVGYRKPPKHSQFKKGQSGNPKGRPRRADDFGHLLIEELETLVHVREGSRARKITKLQVLIKALTAQAIRGNSKATSIVLDHLAKHQMANLPAEANENSLADDDQKILDDFVARRIETMAKKGGGDE